MALQKARAHIIKCNRPWEAASSGRLSSLWHLRRALGHDCKRSVRLENLLAFLGQHHGPGCPDKHFEERVLARLYGKTALCVNCFNSCWEFEP
jgi:hypothetical protein